MKYILSFLFSVICLSAVQAQDIDPVTWTFELVPLKNEIRLEFTATIEKDWYLYAQEIGENGPIPTSFVFENVDLEPIPLTETSKHLVETFDEMFGMELKKYQEKVVFSKRMLIPEDVETINGYIEFMCCNSTQCLPPKQIEFTFNLKQ